MRDPVDSNHDAPETARSRVVCSFVCDSRAGGTPRHFPSALALDLLSDVLLQG
jgi:hypothetical protein